MGALTDYTTKTRRLLRDANATFYTAADLLDAINEGRKQVAIDTACLRVLDTVSLTVALGETYQLSTYSSKGVRAIDLLGITVIWGQTRIPLFWMAFTEFQARMRVWVSNSQRPQVWSNFGTGPSTKVYVQPLPDQTYSSLWDIVYIAADLVDDTTVDELVWPFTDAVPYYVASTLKYKEQNFGEAALYHEQYKSKAAWAITASFTRRMPNPYSGSRSSPY